MTVAYAIAGGLIIGALLYALGLVLDEVGERHRLRRLADDVRRRQVDARTRAPRCARPPAADMTAHLTAARRPAPWASATRCRSCRPVSAPPAAPCPRARAVSVCHDCGERFTTDAAETRHVAATFHARYEQEQP